jgi:hypothetical protein
MKRDDERPFARMLVQPRPACQNPQMSFAEVLAEIPKLTLEQRREVLRRAQSVVNNSGTSAVPGFEAQRTTGSLVLNAPRVIRQTEVDAILNPAATPPFL